MTCSIKQLSIRVEPVLLFAGLFVMRIASVLAESLVTRFPHCHCAHVRPEMKKHLVERNETPFWQARWKPQRSGQIVPSAVKHAPNYAPRTSVLTCALHAIGNPISVGTTGARTNC